jgi:CRP-like cAMP-binding protein
MISAVSNRILESLPLYYKPGFLARLEAVSLPAETRLYEAEETPKYFHFLTSGMTSIVAFMADGKGTEVGVIGREGVVEGLHLLGPGNVRTIQTRGFVQVEGTALRMRFEELRREFNVSQPLRDLILQFVQCQASLQGQFAACNRLHEIMNRLARWLLMVQDRIQSDNLPLTQEFLSQMLGTRRSSVTTAAGNLQSRGLIEYHHGAVRILDRPGLEDAACECYGVARKLYIGLYNNWGGTTEETRRRLADTARNHH